MGKQAGGRVGPFLRVDDFGAAYNRMRSAGAFRIDGDLNRAFEFGIDRLVAALSSG